MFPLILDPPKPGTDSFLNHRALELGKHAHHLKHRLAGRRSRKQAAQPLSEPRVASAQGRQGRPSTLYQHLATSHQTQPAASAESARDADRR
jgi:hypothetical protein